MLKHKHQYQHKLKFILYHYVIFYIINFQPYIKFKIYNINLAREIEYQVELHQYIDKTYFLDIHNFIFVLFLVILIIARSTS